MSSDRLKVKRHGQRSSTYRLCCKVWKGVWNLILSVMRSLWRVWMRKVTCSDTQRSKRPSGCCLKNRCEGQSEDHTVIHIPSTFTGSCPHPFFSPIFIVTTLSYPLHLIPELLLGSHKWSSWILLDLSSSCPNLSKPFPCSILQLLPAPYE